jgi:nitrate/nitrite transport system ATP-binding protein
MSFLRMTGVSKGFGEGASRTEILSDIDLTIEEGEFVAIVGYSGSGKSTLIQLLAGLLTPDSGSVELDGKPIRGPGPDRGVVFQNYSLLPWLTVLGNVELAVERVFPKMGKAERHAHCMHYISMVNLAHAWDRRPAELSGGMRQRVSVARALAMQPRILLLDEPLGALDALTRGSLQDELENIVMAEKRTAVLITNDVDEALRLADRVIPLHQAPRATLGPDFRVPLDRPRDRAALNDSEVYRILRAEINQYLIDLRLQSDLQQQIEELVLPDLAPVHFLGKGG